MFSARMLDERFLSPDWLFQKGSLERPGVKIHEPDGLEIPHRYADVPLPSD
jgi:hypothetical protein